MKRAMAAAVAILVTALAMVPTVQARPMAASKEVDSQFTIGPETKVYDMGPHFGKTPPAGWTKATFDDSNWDHVTDVRGVKPTDHGTDTVAAEALLKKIPAYWGPYQEDYYLFRQTFNVLPALGMHGFLKVYSTSGQALGGYIHIVLNGRTLLYDWGADIGDGRASADAPTSYRVDQFLQPGRNVLAVYAGPSKGLSALYYHMEIQQRGVQKTGATATPTSRPATASAKPPTIFGHGPELMISPVTGKLGRKIEVVGFGFKKGTCVQVIVAPPGIDFGEGGPPPPACGPGQVHINAQGAFYTRVVIPTKLPEPFQAEPNRPLVVLAYNPSAKTAAEAESAEAIFLIE